uniref:Transcription factor CPC isoform X2 n=1 Tax=Elaeis guineensis var. tenera TaxID=51953 RepID=A0A8N4EXZ6_ELAGV|nr:transcription factor CPC isoform X2 [Elaeis guineensis]
MDQLLPASTAFKPSHLLLVSMPSSIRSEAMDKRRGPKQPGTSDRHSQEVSSTEWEFINLSEQEEDLLYRMYRLVGDSNSSCYRSSSEPVGVSALQGGPS